MTNLEAENFQLKFELKQLRSDFDKLLELNKQIISENKILKKENFELKKEIVELKLEIEKLKVKSNEPSGSKPDYLKENCKSNKKHKKSGQKKGHKGCSRTSPKEIHKEKHYYAPDECDKCGSTDLKIIKVRKKIITDLIFKLINIREHLHDKKCLSCGNVVKAISPNGDSQSPYGRNIKSLFLYLRSKCGATLRPLETLFTDYFGLKITDSSISSNELDMSELTKLKYDSYLDKIKKSNSSHKDETSLRVAGKTCWIWVYDDTEHVFYRLSDTRGKQTLIDDFGENPTQISINDCYEPYNLFVLQQICWAHLIRECKCHAEKDGATRNEKIFYRKMQNFLHLAKEYVKLNESLVKRRKKREELESELINTMIRLKKRTDFLRRMFNRLDKHLKHIFLFVEYPKIDPTNNLAERDLRPFVIHRRASFGAKSKKGGEAKVRFKTIFENARRQGRLFFEALDFLFETPRKFLLPEE